MTTLNAVTRLRALSGMALLAIPVSASFVRGESSKSPPNIVFIFSDDHAWQALSAYGDERKLIETPNIDRLAKEGMRFDRCLVTNSICGPSRATVLTGKYSHRNGVYNNTGNTPFDGSQTTFPKILHASGYQTAIVGKWHLESDPTGFDYWQVLPGQGTYYNPEMRTAEGTIREHGYVTDIVTDRSIEWLEHRDKSKPFLLMSQHKAAHRTWEPALRDLGWDKERIYAEPPTLFDDYARRGPYVRDQAMSLLSHMNDGDLKLIPGEPVELDDEQRAKWEAFYQPIRERHLMDRHRSADDLVRWKYQRYMQDYLACVKALDDNVGRLLDYLDESGLAENTIVIYSSDQGFFLGEHGWFDKRWIFEESLRTPLLVRWPGQTKPGSSSAALVSNLDFAETMLEVAGANVPEEMQGRSLVPLLRGERPADWRRSFYYHYYEFPRPHRVPSHYGVVTDRYKLVRFYGDEISYTELYDRQRDPHELSPVTLLPEYGEVRRELEAELLRLRTELGDPDNDDPRARGRPQEEWERIWRERFAPTPQR